jgi:hypothetical protein
VVRGGLVSEIFVNTGDVISVANNLKNLNNDIKNNFSQPYNSVKQLANYWESPSSRKAIEKMGKIKSDFEENRYKVMNNYANFLLRQVGESYDNTEAEAESLADVFK